VSGRRRAGWWWRALRRTALHRLAPLTDVDLVLVGGQAPAEQVCARRDRGANVEVVEV
jgi:hypothetical protein